LTQITAKSKKICVNLCQSADYTAPNISERGLLKATVLFGIIAQMKRDRKQIYTTFSIVLLLLSSYALLFPPYADALVGDDYVQFDYVKQIVEGTGTILGAFNPLAIQWYYRPLQNVWWWLNEQILGSAPFGFYAVQLPVHLLAVALTFRVARQFGLRRLPAFAAAALFAIHSHYVDVVGWISAIALLWMAVWALTAVSLWQRYLHTPTPRLLALTGTALLLALLTHEQWILLPPLLLLLLLLQREWLAEKRPWPLPLNRREWRFFALFALLVAGYIAMQFLRPNSTFDLGGTGGAAWLALFSSGKFIPFITATSYRFTFALQLIPLTGWNAALFTLFLLILLTIWYWQGDQTVRWGLLWAGLHLLFIYGTLWNQLPELYAGRHTYQAGIGLALAIGATFEQLLPRPQPRPKRGRKARRQSKPAMLEPLLVIFILLAALLYHSANIRAVQRVWFEDTRVEQEAEQQLKGLLPAITAENHIFAYRFPIAPQFMRSVAQIWYDVPLERPGGSIDHLRAHGEATDQFYVFDYDDGTVRNIMPELQEAARTIFIWAESMREEQVAEDGAVLTALDDAAVPGLVVVAAGADRRLAVPAELGAVNGRWLRQTILIDVPENAELATAVLLHPDLQYRLTIIDAQGKAQTVYQSLESVTTVPTWDEIRIPLDDYASEPLILRLETKTTAEREEGYWANPRFMVKS
jgi:hypothetical protein